MAADGQAAETRLACYGTLAPGQPNHAELAALNGQWRRGVVRGHLAPEGWGASLGYPTLTLDPDGPRVEVEVLESPDLPAHWARLDAFEGPGYRRDVTEIETDEGMVRASIYVAAKVPQ